MNSTASVLLLILTYNLTGNLEELIQMQARPEFSNYDSWGDIFPYVRR